MKTHIAINGACGRMGQRLVALAHEDAELAVVAAVDSPNHPRCGADAGELAGVGRLGIPVTGEIPPAARVDCVIDFSAPAGTMAVNISGSFLLGLLVGLTAHHGLSTSTSVVLGAGFTGGYTTLSTWAWESYVLATRPARGAAAVNVIGSLALGMAAGAAGLGLALLG